MNRDIILKLISGVVSVSFILALVVNSLFFLGKKDAIGSDFVSFLTGAEILSAGQGENLYDFQTQYDYQQKVIKPLRENSILPYLNIPIFAWLLIPLTQFTLLSAFKIYVVILLSILGLSVIYLRKTFKNISKRWFWLLLPFIFYPSIGSVFVGQITPLLLMFLLVILLFLKKKKEVWVGLATSLFLIKFQYIILFAYIFVIVDRKAAYVKGFLIGSGLLLLASLILTEGRFFDLYVPFVFALQKPEYGISVKSMFTLHSSLAQIFPFSTLSYGVLFGMNALAYIISVIFFWTRSKLTSLPKLFSAAVILTLIFSVHGVNYDYGLVLIPILTLIDQLKSEKGIGSKDKLALFIFLITPTFFVFQRTLYVSFLLLTGALILLRKDYFPNEET